LDETGIALFGISALAGLIAVVIRYLEARFRARALRVSAIVSGHRTETQQQERDGETIFTDVHRAVFRYRDASGTEREALSRVATNPPSHEEGTQVTILYDPADPTQAVPDGDTAGQRVPLVLGLLAAAGMLFALLRAATGF